MKKIVTILALAGICISCNKSSNTPQREEISQVKTTGSKSGQLEKKFVANGHDTVILQIVLTPALVCYSYRNGEPPKPCDIFIDFTCTLSQPVNRCIYVAIQKKNMIGTTDRKLKGSVSGTGIVINIAPNTTKLAFRSTFRNNNNIVVAEDNFSIENVNVYQFID